MIEIRALLQAFQDGYTRRDPAGLDAFMELFTPAAEVIGTGGMTPGESEWYRGRGSAREMIAADWDGWGDFRLDLENATIQFDGGAGWLAAPATVTITIGEAEYARYLDYLKEHILEMPLPPKEKLLYILRGASSTLYELERGETFTWPLRFTAVVVQTPDGWKFAQVHFSFPTLNFPDARIFSGE